MDVFWYINMFSTDPVTQFYICKLTFVNIIQRYYLLKSKAMLLFHYFLLSFTKQNRLFRKKHTNDAFWYALYYIIELYNLKSFKSRAGKHVIKCHLFKFKKKIKLQFAVKIRMLANVCSQMKPKPIIGI